MCRFLISCLFLLNVNTVFAQSTDPQLITISGTGESGYNGDNQPAVQAQFHYPHNLCVDQSGNVYIADQHNQRIRKIDPQTGLITTVAGNGNHSYSGNGGPATQASLGAPLGVFIDPNGHLFIADTENNRIRKVDKNTNQILTVAGYGPDGFSGDDVLATQSKLWHPRNMFVTDSGDLYIADTKNNRIRKVDAQTNHISTVAGTGEYGYSGDDSLATMASLGYPTAVWITDNNDLYILDYGNHRIRKVDAQTGIIKTIGPTNNNRTPLSYPNDFFIHTSGAIYVSDSMHNRILKLENDTWSIVGGSGKAGFDDGAPLQATLNYPSGIAIDSNNTLYIADRFNHSIRKVTHIDQVDAQIVQPNTFTTSPLNPPPTKTPPVAIPDTFDVKPNSSLNVYVLRNDYDNENDALTVTETTQGAHSERVVINSNGTIYYRPLPNYEGEDQFSYTISDGNGGTATAQVFITVIDRPPFVNRLLSPQSLFLDEHQITIDLGGSQPVILDPQHEPLRLTAISQDSTIAIATLNFYELAITPQAEGQATIQITGTDSIGQSATTTVIVNVKTLASQIGEPSLGILLDRFESRFQSGDWVSLTGPASIDTLDGKNRNKRYLTSLSQNLPENRILALRQNYDQIKLWLLIKSLQILPEYGHITENETQAHIEASMYFDSIGLPSRISQPYLDLPATPFSVKAEKLSSGWVINNFEEIMDTAAEMIGAQSWPQANWHLPNLILSSDNPPIKINLHQEPRLFRNPNDSPLTYTTRESYITGSPARQITIQESVIQDSFLVISPRSLGEHRLLITTNNGSENPIRQRIIFQVKSDIPITVSDSAQVIQGQTVDIPVLTNDHTISNAPLRVLSTTQGAKSKTIEILENNLIRYTPYANATGTDWFTYRINDHQGNLSDGFVFINIQAKEITPDFNSDGEIDFSDFILFASAFGSNDPNYDLNGDGQVSFPDFIIFGQAFTN